MGIRLVRDALNNSWCGLSDRARLVLVSMCMTALDRPSDGNEPGRYYKGHRALLTDLYGTDWDHLSATQKESAEKLAKRAIRELKEAGAITLVSSSGFKTAATYDVHPERFPGVAPVDNSAASENLGVHPVSPNGVHPVSPKVGPRGTESHPLGVHPVYPRGEHIGEQVEQEKVEDPTQPSTELSARDR